MTPQRWFALVLGLVLGAYWARVIRMAIKQRRRTGRGANFVPPEPLGRAIRIVWIPVVVAWVALPFVVAYKERPPAPLAPLAPLASSAALGIAGLVLAALAVTGSVLCWRRMGESWRMGIDPGEKTPLVLTGPYAYVRHPIYALSSLLMVATVMVMPSPLMIVLALLHLTCLQWEARREEQHLLATNGQEYAGYCARVGRFVPRLFARR